MRVESGMPEQTQESLLPWSQLELLEPDHAHLKQQYAVLEWLDFGVARYARSVAHRHLHQGQLDTRGAEEQVEVSERVELAKLLPGGRDTLVIGFPQDLRPAQRILDALTQEPGKDEAEELISEQIHYAHRFIFHGVDETRPVDEPAFVFCQRQVEAGQIFWRHGQVGIEDHQDI